MPRCSAPRVVACWATVAVLGALVPATLATARGEPRRDPPPAATPERAEPTGTAEAAGPPLSREHRRFLEDVAPLISTAEREAFLGLAQEYQRGAFIERFWRVRDPFPETAANELRQSYQERLEVARAKYDDLTEERARHLLLYGVPADVREVRCPTVLKPMEVWAYRGAYATTDGFHLVFYRVGGSHWRLWSPRDGLYPLLDDLASTNTSNPAIAQAIDRECFRGDQLLSALDRTLDVSASDSPVPDPGVEWLATFVQSTTDLPEGAERLAAELVLSYPGRHQSRTVLQGVVEVDPADLTPAAPAEGSSLNLLLDGEVVRDGELFESFRYRFQFAPDQAEGDGVTLPLIFERYLRPGRYRLVVRAQDLESGRFFREERELTVPSLFGEEVLQVAAAAPTREPAEPAGPEPAAEPASARLAEANATLDAGDWAVRILPPPTGLLTGVTRVEALATGEGIERVRFLLDGRQVLSKRSPPYSVELPLGEAPKIHRLAVVALGEDDRELARDELVLNAGPHRFAVRLVEPRRGGRYERSLRARAEVEVPEGERLDRVEIYLNDTLVSTLYQPPFVQPVVIPRDLPIAYVQAKAYLEGGSSAEDLVFVNAPENLEELDVHFVELFTSVLDRRGRPVEGLAREDFRVLEDGEPQVIRRFETVTDVPIYAGLLLDTSASMSGELHTVVGAALRFFEQVLTPKDRAAVITFNDTHHLAVRFTHHADVLAGGVAGLVAEGETALYDSLIYSLYYFSGVQGKRALILISDGEDSKSQYRFDDALDYARRTGVAIYTIGLGLPAAEKDVQIKLSHLASETGGRSFLIDGVKELEQVYATIEEELRSQYLLAYQSSNEGQDERFRTVAVELPGKPGLEAQTIRGYYP